MIVDGTGGIDKGFFNAGGAKDAKDAIDTEFIAAVAPSAPLALN